jgi:hypothetical protein
MSRKSGKTTSSTQTRGHRADAPYARSSTAPPAPSARLAVAVKQPSTSSLRDKGAQQAYRQQSRSQNKETQHVAHTYSLELARSVQSATPGRQAAALRPSLNDPSNMRMVSARTPNGPPRHRQEPPGQGRLGHAAHQARGGPGAPAGRLCAELHDHAVGPPRRRAGPLQVAQHPERAHPLGREEEQVLIVVEG